MSESTKNIQPPKLETRSVKTMFTQQEKEAFVGEMLRARREQQGAEMDFEGMKAQHKAKLAALEARTDQLANSLENGWEMRVRRCLVIYDAKNSKKYFYPDDMPSPPSDVDLAETQYLAVEPMTPDDFQQELIQAEAAFEARQELPLFNPIGASNGVLVIGRLKDHWYAALRITIAGRSSIEERLDSEQKGFKIRAELIKHTAIRALDWLVQTIGKDAAKGFEPFINTMVEREKEKVE